jgi:hypothetical protein
MALVLHHCSCGSEEYVLLSLIRSERKHSLIGVSRCTFITLTKLAFSVG